MDAGIVELAGALDDPAAAGVDPDIFRLGVVGIHAAQICQLQAAGALDFPDHAAQGIGVGLQQQGIGIILSAQIGKHTALGGDGCGKAQAFEGGLHPLGGSIRKACGGVDGEKRRCLLPGKVRVFFVNHIALPIICSARPRRPHAGSGSQAGRSGRFWRESR